MGQLVFQATLGGQVNLVGPNTASTFNLNVPAVASTLATTSGTETLTNKTLTSPTLTSPNITTALTLTGAAGTSGQVLTSAGTGAAPTWSTVAAGTGDVVGPASATANGIALFNSTTGKLIKDSAASDGLIYGLTVGRGAGAVATNTAVGASALAANTSAQYTVALGNEALKANTTGDQNTAVGGYTLVKNTTGSNNTAVGVNCTWNNTTGSNNTAIGHGSLNSNTTASNNTAVGYQAGYTNTTASYSTYIGYQAGYSTTGTQNNFFGYQAGYSVTTGTKNTIIGGYNGNLGGLDIRTASNYIVLSDGDGNPRGVFDASGNFLVGTTSNANGSRVRVSSSNPSSGYNLELQQTSTNGGVYYYQAFFAGSTQTGNINSNGTITIYATTSDYRLKNTVTPMTGALAKVAALKPVSYKWNTNGSDGEGFIAHELQEVFPDAVVGKKDDLETYIDDEGNEQTRPKYQSIDTSFLVATLTAAIQEQQAIIQSLAARVTALETA